MSVPSPRADSRARPQGLRVATVSVLLGAAAIAGLLLGSSLTSDAPARPGGESGGLALVVLVLLLVAVGLSFVVGAIVGLRVQRRARAGAIRGGARVSGAAGRRVEPEAEVDPMAEARPARAPETAPARG